MNGNGTGIGIGHNQGPSMEKGRSWRSFQWRQAQKALMPKAIPLAVVKMRVRRARQLGMDYKAYAAIRQATGRDVCGLLFSSNALRIMAGQAAMPEDRRAVLATVEGAERMAAVYRPLSLAEVLGANPLDAVMPAPDLQLSWAETGARFRDFVAERRLVGDQVVLIGETALEAQWLGAARAAGYLPAERYFPSRP